MPALRLDLARAIATFGRTGDEPLPAVLTLTTDGFNARLSHFEFSSDTIGPSLTDRLSASFSVPFHAPTGAYPESIEAFVTLRASKSTGAGLSAALRVSALAVEGGIDSKAFANGTDVEGATFDLRVEADLRNPLPNGPEAALKKAFCRSAHPSGILNINAVVSAERDSSSGSYSVAGDDGAGGGGADPVLGIKLGKLVSCSSIP